MHDRHVLNNRAYTAGDYIFCGNLQPACGLGTSYTAQTYTHINLLNRKSNANGFVKYDKHDVCVKRYAD